MTIYRRNIVETRLLSAIYDIKLIDASDKKTVWKAQVDFKRGNSGFTPPREQGPALAIDITNKMKEDKILRGCEIKTRE